MIENMQDIDKIIGNMLLKQSGLNRQNIVNGLSVRGPELSKFITETVKQSYDLTDVVIIFERMALDESNTNIDETESDDSIRESIAEKISINIYGNQSFAMAKTLKARFESEKVREDLLNSGIHLMQVTNVDTLNEFMNEMLWHRASFDLEIAYEISVNQIDLPYSIEKTDINFED